MDLDAAAAIACDPDAPVRNRVEALVQVVETVALDDLTIPVRIADAIDDLALIDAAISMRRTSIVCAALHQLGTRADLASTRKRVVRRLIAAGAGGIELAGLAIDIGDVLPAATLAAKDFETHIVPRLAGGPPDAIVGAWLGWLADQPDIAVVAVLRRLAQLALGTLGTFDALFAFATNPARSARLHSLARSIVAA